MASVCKPDDFGTEMREGVAIRLIIDQSKQDRSAAASLNTLDHVVGIDVTSRAVGSECECVAQVVFRMVYREAAFGEPV